MSIQTINNIVEEYIMYLYTNFEPQPIKLKVKVTRIRIGGVEYYKTKENKIYDPKTRNYIGMYDKDTKTIIDVEEEDEDDETPQPEMTKFDYNYVMSNLSRSYVVSIMCGETKLRDIITSYNIDKNSDEYKLFHFKMYYYNDYGSWYDEVEEKREELFSEAYRNCVNFNDCDEYVVEYPYSFSDVNYNIGEYIIISCSTEHNQELKNFIREIVDSLDSPVILK